MKQNRFWIQIISIIIVCGLCFSACQSEPDKAIPQDSNKVNQPVSQVKTKPIVDVEETKAVEEIAKIEGIKETKMPVKEVREEVKELLKEELKVDDNKQHFKQIENLFKEITDKGKSRPEKRLIQNKLEGYFSSPTEKVIEFVSLNGGKEQLSFHDFTRKVRMVSMDLAVDNIALTESNLVNKIIIRQK